MKNKKHKNDRRNLEFHLLLFFWCFRMLFYFEFFIFLIYHVASNGGAILMGQSELYNWGDKLN